MNLILAHTQNSPTPSPLASLGFDITLDLPLLYLHPLPSIHTTYNPPPHVNSSSMPSSQPAAGHLAIDPKFLSSQPSSTAKTSEPNRNRAYDPKKTHITDQPITKKNWYQHVNWLNVFLIVGIPIYGLVQAAWTPLYWQTAVWAVVYYVRYPSR